MMVTEFVRVGYVFELLFPANETGLYTGWWIQARTRKKKLVRDITIIITPFARLQVEIQESDTLQMQKNNIA